MALNFATSEYIPAVLKSGERRLVSPAELMDVARIDTGRAYLDRSTEELLIGLMQIAFQPDEDQWYALWETPPSKDRIHQALSQYEDRLAWDVAFQFPNNAKDQPVASLLNDSASTRKADFNAAILSKNYDALSVPMAMLSLYAFHQNVPGSRASDGGYTKGGIAAAALRVRPTFDGFWQDIWGCVLPGVGDDASSFFWEKTVRNPVPSKTASSALYFPLTRGVQLGPLSTGRCSMTGTQGEVISTIQTTGSANIEFDENAWNYPLSPRLRSAKSGTVSRFHVRAKSVPNVTSWREWVGYSQSRGKAGESGFEASQVVETWRRDRGPELGLAHLTFTAYGCRYDKLDPIGWAESLYRVPVVKANHVVDFFAEGELIWNACSEAHAALRKALLGLEKTMNTLIRADSDALWLSTENAAERTLTDIASALDRGELRNGDVITQLRTTLIKTIVMQARRIFDQQTAELLMRFPQETKKKRGFLLKALSALGNEHA